MERSKHETNWRPVARRGSPNTRRAFSFDEGTTGLLCWRGSLRGLSTGGYWNVRKVKAGMFNTIRKVGRARTQV